MSKGIEIRCYDYVNRPYHQVSDALRKDALSIFRTATKAAASRARSVAAELRLDLGGIEFGADIVISVKSIEEKFEEKFYDKGAPAATHLQLEWQAAKMAAVFPVMKADLAIYPLTSTETQLDFSGVYEPPLGAVGKAMNAIVGRRIAEASVYRFVNEVAEYLRSTLAAGGLATAPQA